MTLAVALATGDVSQLPSRRDEDWRWTDLRGLLRVLPPSAGPLDLGALAPGPFDDLADRVEILGGQEGQASLEVPAGGKAAVALRIVSRGESAFSGQVTIRVGEGARLRLFETYEGDAAAYVTFAGLSFDLAPGAAVERVVLAADGDDGVLVSQAEVRLAAGAEFGQTLVTSGARRQRIETTVRHPGAGASLRLDGLYLLADRRHADLTTVVHHAGEGGATSQLTKGVVRDQARAVFQGRIVVQEGADRTDARMGHHALILSDRAEVDAKPELLIHADDVQCAHGNTVGALDEDALFYMRQRGLSEAEARGLLVEAFLGEAADRIWNEAARERIRAWIARRLES